MEFVFLDVLKSPTFKDIKLHGQLILGQGLVDEVDNFNKWLVSNDYKNVHATPAISTFASENSGVTPAFSLFDEIFHG